MSSIFEFVKKGSQPKTETKTIPTTNSSFSIFQAAKNLPEEREPTRAESLAKAPVKGFLKGLSETAESSPLIARGPVSHEMFQQLTNEVFKTQNKAPERFLERGGKIASYAIGPGKAASKLVRGGLATVGGQLAQELGLSEGTQSAIETAAFLTPSSWKGAQKYVSGLYKKAETFLPEGAEVNARDLKKGVNSFISNLKQGGTALSKAPAMTKAKEISSKIHGGKIDVKEMTGFKKTINEARSGLYAEHALDKKGKRTAKRYLDEVSSLIDKTLSEYGKENPKWYEPYKAANEGFGAIENSKRVSNWIGRIIKEHPHASGGALAGTLIGHLLTPKTALATIGGAGLIKGGELVARIVKSPTLRKYYKELIKSAINENTAPFLNNLRKLSKAFESKKDEEES